MKRFSIWIDEALLAVLTKLGKKHDRSIGWLIRKAIEEYVAREKKLL